MCEGCKTEIEQQMAGYNLAVLQAKKYAKENETQVAVYEENGEWKFISAAIAFAERINFRTVISQYSP